MPNDKAESTAAAEFAALLDLLGIGADERVPICSQKPGGPFEANTVPRNRADAEALALSTPYRDQRDVWFGVNPVALPEGYHGRGGDEHVTRCAALFADIDLKAGGVADSATADTVTKEVAAALGQPPAAVVFSGHGGHTYWTLDPDDDAWTLDTEAKRAAAAAIYRRFHRLCADIAGRFGGSVDNVGQLSRILRVPGTYNRKNPDDPTLVELTVYPYGTGGPLSFAEVAEALDAYGVPEVAEDRTALGEVIREPAGWDFGEHTSAYVAAMVAGWRSDRPASRHGWLVSQATRLACAHRLARITAEDHAVAVAVLDERFGALLANHGQARKPTPGEVAGALAWGVQRAASMTDEQAADEIGGPLDDGEEHQSEDQDDDETPAGVTLPPEFWESRPVLAHIREAAWSHMAAPDAVLSITLTRLSASIPPGVRIDTGIGRPMPMHHFGGLVGRSGAFKSAAMETADAAVDLVPGWSRDPYACPVKLTEEDADNDDFPFRAMLGTGQGVLENYWGTVDIEVPVKPATDTASGAGKRGGAAAGGAPKTKTKTVRRQIRTNVMLSVDEGNGLAKAFADPNSILGETLRELWSGANSGQGNAKDENRRRVRRGQYTFALSAGFQLPVLARMFATESVELGTPQRFVFAWTGAPDIPDEPVGDPGKLSVTVPADAITLCPVLREQVRAVLLPLLRNAGTDDETESQRLSLIVRVAALLAILDGRTEVGEDDWTLAETVAETSRAIIAHARATVRRKGKQAKQAERASALAAEVEAEDAKATPEGRVRLRILGYLADFGGRAKWNGRSGLYKRFNGDEAALANQVLGEMDGKQVRLSVEGRGQFVELIR
ncbi:hypothetical protein KUF57_13010 [Mycolicibacterium sp. PAM1]|uniref:hypothetical protein n=1 Tax=Mycolicibacterium sp. PAM1 TaxID=2853535 RepID=UPI001C3DF662|nr:hypothetical protein [Mycolicibacterium sp. PAM1]MBV5244453.1 hypothetical protein [Mycolicibacterium sp. PAM1]